MSAYERFQDEQWPTGTFGEALPPKPPEPPPRPIPRWTPEEQAQHVADMLTALDGWVWHEDHRDEERRHLRLIDDDTHAA